MPDATRRWSERPLPQLVLVRIREFVREPEAVFWTFFFPVLMSAGLGIAFKNRPIEVIRAAIPASAPGAERLAADLARDSSLSVRVLDDSAAARELRTGRVPLVVVPGASGEVEYRYDDTRPDGVLARDAVDAAVQRFAGRTDPVAARETHVREPGARYIDFVVPGLLGVSLMSSGIWGIGFTIVDARRRKLLKRLVATPMPRSAYLASFLWSRLLVLGLEVGALLLFATIAFGVPVRGGLGMLALITVLSALAFGTLGVLVAARARTLEGVSGLMNLTMVPMWVFSGVFFSSARFPAPVQPFVQALPLTAVNDALRASMLEGSTLAQLAPELAIIAAWLAGSFVLALRLFRWT